MSKVQAIVALASALRLKLDDDDLTGEDYLGGLRLMAERNVSARITWRQAKAIVEYVDELEAKLKSQSGTPA